MVMIPSKPPPTLTNGQWGGSWRGAYHAATHTRSLVPKQPHRVELLGGLPRLCRQVLGQGPRAAANSGCAPQAPVPGNGARGKQAVDRVTGTLIDSLPAVLTPRGPGGRPVRAGQGGDQPDRDERTGAGRRRRGGRGGGVERLCAAVHGSRARALANPSTSSAMPRDPRTRGRSSPATRPHGRPSPTTATTRPTGSHARSRARHQRAATTEPCGATRTRSALATPTQSRCAEKVVGLRGDAQILMRQCTWGEGLAAPTETGSCKRGRHRVGRTS